MQTGGRGCSLGRLHGSCSWLSVASARLGYVGKRSRKRRYLAAVPDRANGPAPRVRARQTPGARFSGGASAGTAPAPLNCEIDDVVNAVAAGMLDDDLDRLAGVVSDRMAVLKHARSVALMASLDIGDRVRIDAGVRPLYLQGALGTVAGFVAKGVVIKLDYPVGRFVTGEVRCPPGAVELLTDDG